MDDFATGNDIVARASNMTRNGLQAHNNIITMLIWFITELVGKKPLVEAMGACEQKETLDRMVDTYRGELGHVFRAANLGVLTVQKVVSWEWLPEPGSFASFDEVPYGEALRVLVQPVNAVVSCLPASREKVEWFLRHAAFESHIRRIAEEIVETDGIDSHRPVVDGVEMTLGEYLNTIRRDTVDEIATFLTEIL